jgi:hypothetical protein
MALYVGSLFTGTIGYVPHTIRLWFRIENFTDAKFQSRAVYVNAYTIRFCLVLAGTLLSMKR